MVVKIVLNCTINVKKTLIAIESAYTSAKASGYDVSSARTKLMIKRQLGL